MNILVNILSSRAVRHEIEMIDEQFAQFDEFYGNYRRSLRKVQRPPNSASPAEAAELARQIPEKVQQFRKDSLQQLETLFVPHQWKRLKQIAMQVAARKESVLPLQSAILIRELALTEAQQQRLADTIKNVPREIKGEFNDAYRVSFEMLVEVLSPEQKLRYDALLGTPFSDFQ